MPKLRFSNTNVKGYTYIVCWTLQRTNLFDLTQSLNFNHQKPQDLPSTTTTIALSCAPPSPPCPVRQQSNYPTTPPNPANNHLAPPVDYYAALNIDSKATQQQVRDAYKKAALKHHPDRVPADSPERAQRTKKFQQINDAYYTLSDATRRREYDAARSYGFGFGNFGGSNTQADDPAEEVPRPEASSSMPGGFGNFPWSAFGFGGQAKSEGDANKYSNEQFGSVFEEMMNDEGMAEGENHSPTGTFWSIVGGASGGAMGFIVANVPGAVAGAVAGNRLGAVRDKKGKSVYSVYNELEQPEKMRLLSELASKVFAHAIS
jgi:curved DNA-binding protein CbpA